MPKPNQYTKTNGLDPQLTEALTAVLSKHISLTLKQTKITPCDVWAVLSYAGRSFQWLSGGKWSAAWGWQELRRIAFDGLGVRSPDGVAYRYTFIADPDNVIQHVYATNLNVGRSPKDTLRVLDALQTDELCPCNREVGGATLKVA
jgi:hypothetical protein